MRIVLYGRLRDAIGREIELDAPEGSAVADIRRQLADDYPGEAVSLRRSRSFADDRLVGDDHVPSNGTSLEFLPPVSGG